PTTQRVLKQDPEFLRGQFWSDGMVRVVGREYSGLIESACYIKGEMTCMSCHAMHKPADDTRAMEAWRDDQMKPGMRTNDACLGCHADYAKDISAHTHHPADSAGSQCYNCHMPFTTYGLHKAVRSHQIDSPTVIASLETGRPNACNQCHLDKTMAWAAEHLEQWYDQPQPPLSADESAVAASALWMLKGDAGQRALMAWSMGWPDAVEASGDWWLAPYLMQGMTDPYDAVRLIAYRSLKAQDAFAELPYDFVADQASRRHSLAKASRLFERQRSNRIGKGHDAEAVLIKPSGVVDYDAFGRLLEQRDHRSVLIRE
ncbi:MAG: ammonia-forming cytochrome c nitrite reductase subunit c552, partial [Phycisphaerae bacterium]